MPAPIITLYTDYGEASAYLAMLKGALYSHCPDARLVDVAHDLPSRDLFPTAFCLLRLYSYYPAGTIHLVGIDCGISPTSAPQRALLASAAGQFFLAADNGALGMILQREPAACVIAVPPPSPQLFLARDWLAPLAGRLAAGEPLAALGSSAADWQSLDLPLPQAHPDGLRGQVLHIDRWGNLITNFRPPDLSSPPPTSLQIGATRINRWVRHYAEAPPGELFLLWGAEGWLEISMAGDSAAARLHIPAGTKVVLR